MTEFEQRTLVRTIAGMETSDGAGVKLRRSIGSSQQDRLDPFLMLDEFGTDNPEDYIAGFPPHPHRGFETVTYMIDGHMRHEDHLGNVGELKSGGVQWMTAGRGVIHSEMPQQESGRMRGFQLWINLPSVEKMKPAGYRDIPASELTRIEHPDGAELKIIAGRLLFEGQQHAGPVNSEPGIMATDPLMIDVMLAPSAQVEIPVTPGHNAFVYLYEGGVSIADKALRPRSAGILSDGGALTLLAGRDGARVILFAGKPLNEPVVQYGPFVMNTQEEIRRAISDYQRGSLV